MVLFNKIKSNLKINQSSFPLLKYFKSFLKYFFIISIIFASLLYWLLSTHQGLIFAVKALPQIAGIHIKANQIKGTFLGGLQIKELAITTQGSKIYSDNLSLTWQDSASKSAFIHIKQINLGSIIYESSGVTNEEETIAKLPRSLRLPFDIKIDEIVNSGLFLNEKREMIFSHLLGQFTYLHNQYQLKIVRLETPWSNFTGQVTFHDKRSYPLEGSFSVHGNINEEPIEGILTLSGSIEHPDIYFNLISVNFVFSLVAELSPYKKNYVDKIRKISLSGGSINPHNYFSFAPFADLSFFVSILPEQDKLIGSIQAINNDTGYVNYFGIPVKSIQSIFTIDNKNLLNINQLSVQLIQNGHIEIKGYIHSDKKIDLRASVNARPTDFIEIPIHDLFKGDIHLTGSLKKIFINSQLDSDKNHLLLKSEISQNKKGINILKLFNFSLNSNDNSEIKTTGFITFSDLYDLNLKAEIKKFNPNYINSSFPLANINGQINAKGNILDNLNLILDINQSHISNTLLLAQGYIDFNQSYIKKSDINIKLGNNKIHLKGGFGKETEKLIVDIITPNLSEFGLAGLSGYLKLNGTIGGTWKKPNIFLNGEANQAKYKDFILLEKLLFNVKLSSDLKEPLFIDINGKKIIFGENHIDNIEVNAQGSLSKHTLSSIFDVHLVDKDYAGHIQAHGALNDHYQWNGNINRFNLSGSLNIVLQNTVNVLLSKENINIGSARWNILNGSMNLNSFNWQKNKGFSTQGEAKDIHLKEIENIIALPFNHNLVLKGIWNVQYNDEAKGFIRLEKQSGDLSILDKNIPLELDNLILNAVLSNGKINGELTLESRFAKGLMNINIAQKFGDDIKNAQINGQLKVDVHDISLYRYFLPVGLILKGNAKANVELTGTISSPILHGNIIADNLEYRDIANGVFLKNGILRSHFEEEKWILDNLLFTYKDGEIKADGTVDLSKNIPDINLKLNATKYPVLNQPDKQVLITGSTLISYDEVNGVSLTGDLQLDKAIFTYAESGSPQLDNDVVIKGQVIEKDHFVLPLYANLNINLNDQFYFSGLGIDVVMGGKLKFLSEKEKGMKLLGKVDVIRGKYRSYGQNLIIEEGNLIFTGSFNNPSLNFKAKRYQSPVGAGLEVTGTAKNPRMNLISDTPLSEHDRLAWLVLGRPFQGEGDNQAMALAMGMIAAESLNGSIGLLDNIGFASRQTRNSSTGELNPAEQVVTVGRQLSKKIYIGYEYGLSSASQAVKLIYQIGKSFQLFGRAGTDSMSGGARYNKRYD